MATTMAASKMRMVRIALPWAPPFSPTARQMCSQIERSEDSSSTSRAHKGTRDAYLWGWRTCQARIGQGGRWPSDTGTMAKMEELMSTMAGTTTTTTDVSAFILNHHGAVKTATVTATNATADCTGSGEVEDAIPDFFDAQTRSFGTKDSFSSTLQAAIVIKSLKSSELALLVDEDVSAKNFMARNGRMRTMIMDELITPLLYRVNGLFLLKEHDTSTVVGVRGGG